MKFLFFKWILEQVTNLFCGVNKTPNLVLKNNFFTRGVFSSGDKLKNDISRRRVFYEKKNLPCYCCKYKAYKKFYNRRK